MAYYNNGYQIPDLGDQSWPFINDTMDKITNVLPPEGSTFVTTQHNHGNITTPAGVSVVNVLGSGSTGIVNLPNIPVNRYLATDAGHNIVGVTGPSGSGGAGITGTPSVLAMYGPDGKSLANSLAYVTPMGGFAVAVPGVTGLLTLTANESVLLESSAASANVIGQEVYIDSFNGSALNAYISLFPTPATPAASNCVSMILASVSGVNLTAGGVTSLYTVLAGQNAIVTSVIVRCTNATSVIGIPSASVISVSSPTFEIFDSRTLGWLGYDPTQNAYRFVTSISGASNDTFHICTAGETIQFSVDVPGTASVYTAAIDLFGYIL
jgi:hypothetical protein